MNWDDFFVPYQQAVAELKLKFKALRQQYQTQTDHCPIEFVTGRVKAQASIEEKIVRRHLDESRLALDLQDIAGVRIMTKYVDDIYMLVELLRQRSDFEVLEERDYVSNAKPSGYRSYHIVIDYPVQLVTGEYHVLAEIQIRTMAMNFWATVEHDLSYKHTDLPAAVTERLSALSEMTYALDQELTYLRTIDEHDS